MGLDSISRAIYVCTMLGKMLGDLLNIRVSHVYGRLRCLQVRVIEHAHVTSGMRLCSRLVFTPPMDLVRPYLSPCTATHWTPLPPHSPRLTSTASAPRLSSPLPLDRPPPSHACSSGSSAAQPRPLASLRRSQSCSCMYPMQRPYGCCFSLSRRASAWICSGVRACHAHAMHALCTCVDMHTLIDIDRCCGRMHVHRCNLYAYLVERFPTTIRSTGFGVARSYSYT